MNFRVGDKVRRISHPWGNAIVGGEYYVSKAQGDVICIKGDDEKKYDSLFFILVSKEERVRKLLSKI